jgi:glycosyltransferase involved in cell wall biosynthesis
MASGCCIYAHDNEFNRCVLDSYACFFKDDEDLAEQINSHSSKDCTFWKSENIKKIEETYSWSKIIHQYEKLLLSLKN